MKNNEKVSDYISRVILITNEMKACGETLSEQVIIEKVLRSLTPQFDYIVVDIEHSKDLETMKIEELQSSLEVHELRFTDRTSEREVEQALKASFVKKDQKQNRRSDKFQKSEAFYSDEKHQKGNERRKVQCYCCKQFGHFARDFWSNKEKKSEEANIAKRDSDDEPVLLMASDSDCKRSEDWWYMYTGCSNHLTGNKQWLIDFDSRRRTKIKCVDDKYLNAEGMGNVRFKVKNGKNILIKDVWYIPGIRSNMISVGQLIEKCFSIVMKDNLLKLYDSHHKLIMKSKQGSNRTFKVNVSTAEAECLSTKGVEGDSKLWHKRLG